jgi:hypothetical protein
MTNPELHQESGAMSEGAHAVGYANSLVGYFTAQETLRRGAEAVAKLRASGLITFPEDRGEPKPRRAYTHTFTDNEKRDKCFQIHKLRREGVKARLAAKEGGNIAYQTYSRWMDELNIPYSGPSLSGLWRR